MKKRNPESVMVIVFDFGTGEFYAMSVVDGVLICLDETGFSMPSDIVIDEDGSVLFGRTARNMARLYPDRHTATYKRSMGETAPVLVIPDKQFTSQDLTTLALSEVYKRIYQAIGSESFSLVITCPAYFGDYQRSCLKKAAQEAGFDVIGIVDEPVAAAVAADALQRPGTKSLIVDVGAGTSDVTLVEWKGSNAANVLGKRGDRDLAGNDIERAMMEAAVKRAESDLGAKIDFSELATRQDLAELSGKVKDAKHILSDRQVANLRYSLGGKQHVWDLTRDEFNGLITGILDGIRELIQQTLEDAGVGAGGVDEVVLVGGTSYVPAVRELVAELMGRAPTCKGNPQEAVVRGAALLAPGFMKKVGGGIAEMANGLPSASVKNILGYALSIAVVKSKSDHRLVAREMISRGVNLPAQAERHFQPVEDGQTGVRVLLVPVSGGTDVADSMAIGCVNLDIPARHGAQNQERILVRITVDESSLIRVSSKDRESGTEKEVEVAYQEASHEVS